MTNGMKHVKPIRGVFPRPSRWLGRQERINIAFYVLEICENVPVPQFVTEAVVRWIQEEGYEG